MNIFEMIILITSYLFLACLVGYSLYLFLSTIVSYILLYKRAAYKKFCTRLNLDYCVPISILIPVHNAEQRIVNTINNLLELNYKTYEIIIIDDGSTDKTVKKLTDAFHLKKINRPIRKVLQSSIIQEIYETNHQKVKITLLKEEFSGRASAMNAGMNVAEYPYITCMDADSMLDKNALVNIVRPILEDENITVCSGSIRVGNGLNLKEENNSYYHFPFGLLPSMQEIEYNRFFLRKKMLNAPESNIYTMKAFHLLKKETVMAAGGYDIDATGEDFELLMKLKSFCHTEDKAYIVKYIPEAICWIQAPNKISTFFKQRRVWNKRMLKEITRYKNGLPFTLFSHVYGYILPYIECFGILSVIASCFLHLIDIKVIILFLLSYLLFCSFLSFYIFIVRLPLENQKLSISDKVKAILFAILETVILRCLLLIAKLSFFLPIKKENSV